MVDPGVATQVQRTDQARDKMGAPSTSDFSDCAIRRRYTGVFIRGKIGVGPGPESDQTGPASETRDTATHHGLPSMTEGMMFIRIREKIPLWSGKKLAGNLA